MKFGMIDFKIFGDNRGKLAVFENGNNLPFDLKRIFYSYDLPFNAIRGCHANRKSKFVLISVSGSCQVKVDDGINKQDFLLDTPEKGLFLDRMVWKEMYNFSEDNVLLVLSDQLYDSEEYIKTYEEFLLEINK